MHIYKCTVRSHHIPLGLISSFSGHLGYAPELKNMNFTIKIVITSVQVGRMFSYKSNAEAVDAESVFTVNLLKNILLIFIYIKTI